MKGLFPPERELCQLSEIRNGEWLGRWGGVPQEMLGHLEATLEGEESLLMPRPTGKGKGVRRNRSCAVHRLQGLASQTSTRKDLQKREENG